LKLRNYFFFGFASKVLIDSLIHTLEESNVQKFKILGVEIALYSPFGILGDTI
jgi:hypothetical protein